MSRYESLRTDPANWKLGIIYCCKEDPRLVVRTLLPIGWTWNFGQPKVFLAIPLAIAGFLAPPWLAWQLGVRSPLALGGIAAAALITIVFLASRQARDPTA